MHSSSAGHTFVIRRTERRPEPRSQRLGLSRWPGGFRPAVLAASAGADGVTEVVYDVPPTGGEPLPLFPTPTPHQGRRR